MVYYKSNKKFKNKNYPPKIYLLWELNVLIYRIKQKMKPFENIFNSVAKTKIIKLGAIIDLFLGNYKPIIYGILIVLALFNLTAFFPILPSILKDILTYLDDPNISRWLTILSFIAYIPTTSGHIQLQDLIGQEEVQTERKKLLIKEFGYGIKGVLFSINIEWTIVYYFFLTVSIGAVVFSVIEYYVSKGKKHSDNKEYERKIRDYIETGIVFRNRAERREFQKIQKKHKKKNR